MIKSIQSKALKRFWTKGKADAVNPDWRKKITLVLNAMSAARKPTDLDLPGFGFHALTGDLAGRFAVTVTRNWRITFAWDGEDAVNVDMEDYHG